MYWSDRIEGEVFFFKYMKMKYYTNAIREAPTRKKVDVQTEFCQIAFQPPYGKSPVVHSLSGPTVGLVFPFIYI